MFSSSSLGLKSRENFFYQITGGQLHQWPLEGGFMWVYPIINQRYIVGRCPLKDFMMEAVTQSERRCQVEGGLCDHIF